MAIIPVLAVVAAVAANSALIVQVADFMTARHLEHADENSQSMPEIVPGL
jgi:ABC-type tungstate transport system substrate-binding protein